MRQINKSNDKTGLNFDKVAGGLSQRLKTLGGHNFVSQAGAKVSFGLESMTEEDVQNSEVETNEVTEILKEEVGEDVWNEELTEGQRNSGIITMTASGDPESYHALATAEVTDNQSQLDPSSVDVQNVSQESYDAREIEKMMPISVAYNVGAARQDEAMEALWPTISLTADQAGLNIEIVRNMVHHHFTHNSQGNASKELFGQKNLIHALIDSSILKNQATDIVPVYNTESGVFDEQVGVIPQTIDNTSVDTGAILFNTPFNLIAIGGSSLTDPFGARDMTDTVDSLVRLKEVFVEITDDASHTSIVPIDVLDLNLTQFQKSQEGADRDVTLNWTSNSITITGNQLDKTGVVATALEAFRTSPYDKFVIVLKMNAGGRLNLADGNGELHTGSVTVDGFYKSVTLADGSQDLVRIADSAEILAAKAKITALKLRSFKLDARYANLNRRERGLIVRQDIRNARYTIPLQPPITALKPVTDTKSGYAVDSAIQATRVANTTAGVAELMRMDDFLSRYRNSSSFLDDNNATIGIGAYLIRPYYERKVVEMTKLINNVNSHTLPLDINAHLTLLVRDCFAKAMMISGWMAAQQCSGSGSKEKPTAVIITDPRTAQYLFIHGDTRLLGDSFNAKPVVSNFLEFRDKIYIAPRRESSVNQPDGLNWGNMFWLPELITNMPIARGGQISNEFTAQTRRRHICHCPILIRIDLKDMNKVIDTKVPMSVVV